MAENQYVTVHKTKQLLKESLNCPLPENDFNTEKFPRYISVMMHVS